MKTENAVLMQQARKSLEGKWALAIGVFLLYGIIIGGVSYIPNIGSLIMLIIGGPLVLGVSIFSIAIARNKPADFSQLFLGFNKFGIALGAYLLVALFVLLWSLLLIIPGIIAAFSYSMTFFILADNKSIGIKDDIDKSKKMMYGNKWKLFCLSWRFFGWALLCVLTLGIGFLWLSPYMQISYTKFYDDIKG